MMTDKSYTPIFSAFEEALCAYFPATSPTQTQALKQMFFAGASVACGLMTDTPDVAETIKEELIDYADHLEAA